MKSALALAGSFIIILAVAVFVAYKIGYKQGVQWGVEIGMSVPQYPSVSSAGPGIQLVGNSPGAGLWVKIDSTGPIDSLAANRKHETAMFDSAYRAWWDSIHDSGQDQYWFDTTGYERIMLNGRKTWIRKGKEAEVRMWFRK